MDSADALPHHARTVPRYPHVLPQRERSGGVRAVQATYQHEHLRSPEGSLLQVRVVRTRHIVRYNVHLHRLQLLSYQHDVLTEVLVLHNFDIASLIHSR